MAVPNIFGSATSAIPLSQLDTNFATPVTIGNTAVQLGNTVTSFGNVTLTNVTISSGNVTITGANVSGTANVSTLVVTGSETVSGNTAVTGNITASFFTSTSTFGFKNRLINGAMGISQRTAVNTNVAVGTGTAGTFGPDRFTGYSGTASLWNILQVTTGVYDFPYALRLQRIAGQTSTSAIYLRQVIETNNCIDLAGQTVTLSFYATAGANYSGGAVTTQIYTGTASDQGTASLNSGTWTGFVSPIASTFTPTTTRTRFSFTATLGSTVQEVAFGLNWSGSGTAGANDYLDITGVQVEKGSTATSFDYRPYGTELQLCQRYLPYFNVTAGSYFGVGQAYATTAAIFFLPLSVPPRVPATGITSTGTFSLLNSAGSDLAATSGPTINGAASTTLGFTFAVTAGLVGGNAVQLKAATNAVIYGTGCEL